MSKAMENQAETPAPPGRMPLVQAQAGPERVTAHQKDPKRQGTGRRRAEDRKKNQEALLEQLRSVKAKLQQSTDMECRTADIEASSPTAAIPNVAVPSGLERPVDMECRTTCTADVSPWLYWSAGDVLAAAAVYVSWGQGEDSPDASWPPPPESPLGI